MMNRTITVLILTATVLFSSPAMTLSRNEPVALLIQSKGKVMYSPDGITWKNVRRNRFLFEGWHVKTASDGSCKLINQQTGMIETVEVNTHVKIFAKATKAVMGMISTPEPASDFMSLLKRKFAKVQKYSAIKRHSKYKARAELETVRKITLSRDYPDLVWENAGSEYSYRLVIGKNIFDIPASDNDMIRFPLNRMPSGPSDYYVQLIRNGEIAYTPEKKGRIHWMSDAEIKEFREEETRIRETDPAGFLLGNFMDDRGLKVAAMDLYRKFIAENPDANEMRPFLIKIFGDLKLRTLKDAEMAVYHGQSK